MSSEIILWEGAGLAKIPANETTPEQILTHANSRQLNARDRSQIIYAFNNQSYEMVSNFIWNKATSSLKAQLGRLGTAFIAEMLDRPDIPPDASITQVLTDYDALRLAKELGVVNPTGYLRLKHSFDLIAHFGQLSAEDADDSEFSINEAVGVIRACVETILGQDKIDVAVDFKAFRDGLESTVFDRNSTEIKHVESSPYFFKRASVRILLALVKSKSGAQLENALGNANLIIPLLWSELFPPERFQIGRAYSETVADGKTQAASGLRKVLLKVRGFDYVPEDLRSRSFRIAAQRVIEAHEGVNNFYNEPGPAKALAEMGSTIPRPAFPLCMTAILSVRLGNPYGICYEAQSYVNSILRTLNPERWLFYLDKCLRTDERILEKISNDKPFRRWVGLVTEFDLTAIAQDLRDKDVKLLLQESKDADKPQRARNILTKLEKKMGFAVDQ
ncbi:MAG TPA: hypothetical protein VGR84_02330 [Candidatus Acidoferrales bacterium]|nr:hypothetical protein [Candidatus Acidoferrales bacterium]